MLCYYALRNVLECSDQVGRASSLSGSAEDPVLYVIKPLKWLNLKRLATLGLRTLQHHRLRRLADAQTHNQQ